MSRLHIGFLLIILNFHIQDLNAVSFFFPKLKPSNNYPQSMSPNHGGPYYPSNVPTHKPNCRCANPVQYQQSLPFAQSVPYPAWRQYYPSTPDCNQQARKSMPLIFPSALMQPAPIIIPANPLPTMQEPLAITKMPSSLPAISTIQPTQQVQPVQPVQAVQPVLPMQQDFRPLYTPVLSPYQPQPQARARSTSPKSSGCIFNNVFGWLKGLTCGSTGRKGLDSDEANESSDESSNNEQLTVENIERRVLGLRSTLCSFVRKCINFIKCFLNGFKNMFKIFGQRRTATELENESYEADEADDDVTETSFKE